MFSNYSHFYLLSSLNWEKAPRNTGKYFCGGDFMVLTFLLIES